MTFKILSCDGGGIRGLITALLIQDLDRRSGIVATADGFAGTSTGGLIALGLARGVSISTIVDVYKTKGSEIFQENPDWIAQQAALETGAVLGGPGYIDARYLSSGLKKVAEDLLGTGNLASLSRFAVVNSAQLWDSSEKSWVPGTISNASNNAYRNISLVDAALATSAAPTYFPPHEIAGFGYFADGGVFANNPSITAISEALASGLSGNPGDLLMLSLGTGTSPQGIPESAIGDPLSWGVSKWLWPLQSNGVPATALLSLTLDTTAMLAAHQAGQILERGYQRGNFVLSQNIGLDDWEGVPAMEKETNAYMKSPEWQAVCDWVEQNWR